MIFVNLLPDIKLERLKARRIKRIAVSLSMLLIVLSVAWLSFLIYSTQFQQKNAMVEFAGGIAKKSLAIKSEGDIDRVLDIQGKLALLPILHAKKSNPQHLFSDNNFTPITTGLYQEPHNRFGGYLDDLLPNNFRSTEIDFNLIDGNYKITGIFDVQDPREGFLKAIAFWYTIAYVGLEPCTESNRDTRVRVFEVTSEEPAAPSLDDSQTEEGYKGYSFEISGKINVNDPNLFGDKITELHLPVINVGAEGLNPGLCYSIKDKTNVQPLIR